MVPNEKKTKNKLIVQMMLWFVLISIIPLTVASYVYFVVSSNIFNQSAIQNLQGIAQRQSQEIKTYIKNTESNAALIAQNASVIEALSSQENISTKQQLALREIVFKYSLSNLYLINTDGSFIYNVQKGRPSQNPIDLKHPLYYIFDRTLKVMTPQFSDIINHPSFNGPSIFFTSPIMKDGKLLGITVLQTNAKDIYQITNNYAGLGSTGETLLLQETDNGPAILNPTRQPLGAITHKDKKALPYHIKNVLSGQRGLGKTLDYREIPVIAVWEYIPNMRWGLVVKKDLAEAFAPIKTLRQQAITISSITFIVALLTATLATRAITHPILVLTRFASQIAQGNLKAKCPQKMPSNEIGVLAQSLEFMRISLKSLIAEVKKSSSQIFITYKETSAASKKQLQAAEQTAQATQETCAFAKEISSTADELYLAIENINNIIHKTAIQAAYSRDRLHLIEETIEEIDLSKQSLADKLALIDNKTSAISNIVATMATLVDRINLLSINTAIEAQHAGPHGSGFKMIAKEMRKLADQAAMFSSGIEDSILSMEEAVQTGNNTMREFSEKVAKEAYDNAQASSFLEKLIEEVEQLPELIENLQSKINYQIKRSKVIQKSIISVNESAQHTAGILGETHQTLENLQNNSYTSQKEIAKYLT